MQPLYFLKSIRTTGSQKKTMVMTKKQFVSKI